MIKKKLAHLCSLIEQERDALKKKFLTALLDENIESLRKSGKPFYWTDSDRLRKLKRLCESQKDETVRERAL